LPPLASKGLAFSLSSPSIASTGEAGYCRV
jgi:hypothetical protein